MHTSALFSPTPRMLKAFMETQDTGLARIEISYYTDSREAEDMLFT